MHYVVRNLLNKSEQFTRNLNKNIMIIKEQRVILKKYLKGEYIEDVLKKLEEKKQVSRKGTPYGPKMISHVLNGRYENLDIEAAIVAVYEERKTKAEKNRRNLDNLLGLNDGSK